MPWKLCYGGGSAEDYKSICKSRFPTTANEKIEFKIQMLARKVAKFTLIQSP